ncbi:MAG: hypothetical protein ACXACO_15560 [Promethearchaeota archaeon]|jgi:hypothetical protein
MTDEMLKFTKITFIIHFVLGLLFTILFWIPDITAPMYGIAVTSDTHAMSLTIGALFAGLTVSSLCGFLAKEWKEVKIIVIAEVVWLVASIITFIISFSVYEVGTAVLSLITSIILLILFLLTFLQQEEMIKTLWK